MTYDLCDLLKRYAELTGWKKLARRELRTGPGEEPQYELWGRCPDALNGDERRRVPEPCYGHSAHRLLAEMSRLGYRLTLEEWPSGEWSARYEGGPGCQDERWARAVLKAAVAVLEEKQGS